MRTQTWLRLWTFVTITLGLGIRLLIGALSGLLLWGLVRWRRHKDWRVLGALLRVLCGGVIGFVIWWSYVRPIDPEDFELLALLLQIGSSVGLLWAVVWLVFMQPPPRSPERTLEREGEQPDA